MAEAITRKIAVEKGLTELDVASAGTSAWDSAPASDGGLLVAMERGMDLSEHRAQSLTRELVRVARRHAQGRIVSCLEGGYALGALARSVAAHLRVLAAVD